MDAKKILNRFLQFKHTYIIIVLVFLATTFVINKISDRTYKNSSLLLIKEKNNRSFLSSDAMMENLNIFSGQSNLSNEFILLRSFDLIRETVQSLDFHVSYYQQNYLVPFLKSDALMMQRELYHDSPIQVNIDKTNQQIINIPFRIKFINDSTYQLTASSEDALVYNYIDGQITDRIDDFKLDVTANFGEQIKADNYSFSIVKTDKFYKNFTSVNDRMVFYFQSLDMLTENFIASIEIEQPTAGPAIGGTLSSILQVNVYGRNFDKVTDFLNTYLINYIDKNIEDKNREALNTVRYINNLLSSIEDSLAYSGTNLRDFRKEQNVVDISYQGQQLYEELNELEEKKAAFLMQKRYYTYIQNYFNENKDDFSSLVSPASMNVNDPILTDLVTKLIQLESEKGNILSRSGESEKNLYLKDYQIQINNLKKSILENVRNNLSALEGSLKEMDQRISSVRAEMSQLPQTELNLMNIERKHTINDAIFTYLLQKRSEAQIARAASSPDYEIIEKARYLRSSPVGPKTLFNYVIALFLALLLPTAFILAYDFLNNKITEQAQLENLDYPLLGHIIYNKTGSNLVVQEHPDSAVVESFRNAKTNLDFLSPDKQKQIITYTSSISGDGKSFCSLNMANVLAMNGFKVVILEFDLRKPNLHKYLNVRNTVGLSSYLSSQSMLEDIIVQTPIENLDMIAVGTLPPNPAELISSGAAKELFEVLRTIYDYIIVDTAPVGIVSESLHLMSQSDINILVVRQNHTDKTAFTHTLKTLKNNNLTNVVTLFNGVSAKKGEYSYKYKSKYYSGSQKR